MSMLRKKRLYAVIFIGTVLALFSSQWLGYLIYPIHYEQEIREIAKDYGVDPLFMAAIVRVESNFKPDKSSKKNAMGLMQIMPETGEWVLEQAGFRDNTIGDLYEPTLNLKTGAWYLRFLHNMYDGLEGERTDRDRMALVAAAYNAGPGKVRQWLNEGVWDGKEATLSEVPFGETRHYVHRVLYYYKKYEALYAEDWS
ncbi:lytic transglycosylase domain-containing protein [Xylanibacillus composti]|uniref:Transglycosylase SLT domain protein n=1 Tax=Xylanibacillus composti TaxID=1572762 RepID=A0A8J4H5D4_9BACL|nr:lytic transglycosylase domain-containing protein [Xylanibacillus composti]MDT9724821.1 lytic transglycosylase domain-containing protein [Xylanibacillus composti]GIQ69826.1 transglycosylase SLT domain protein [Xylanibacillus composti]